MATAKLHNCAPRASRRSSTAAGPLRAVVMSGLLLLGVVPLHDAGAQSSAKPHHAHRDASTESADSTEPAQLRIVWPVEGSVVEIGQGDAATIAVVAQSNYELKPAGQCAGMQRCGHLHMKIDPEGDACNLPGKPYNSMNSDFGGDLIKAHFGACSTPQGVHTIGILLADDQHRPVLVNGAPVTALVQVTTKVAAPR